MMIKLFAAMTVMVGGTSILAPDATAASGSAVSVVSGSICGQVVDSVGRPIPGAHIVLAGHGGSLSTGTDHDGEYCFDGVAGEFMLSVTAPGFRPSTRRVLVPEGRHAQSNFTLGFGAVEDVEVY